MRLLSHQGCRQQSQVCCAHRSRVTSNTPVEPRPLPVAPYNVGAASSSAKRIPRITWHSSNSTLSELSVVAARSVAITLWCSQLEVIILRFAVHKSRQRYLEYVKHQAPVNGVKAHQSWICKKKI